MERYSRCEKCGGKTDMRVSCDFCFKEFPIADRLRMCLWRWPEDTLEDFCSWSCLFAWLCKNKRDLRPGVNLEFPEVKYERMGEFFGAAATWWNSMK